MHMLSLSMIQYICLYNSVVLKNYANAKSKVLIIRVNLPTNCDWLEQLTSEYVDACDTA